MQNLSSSKSLLGLNSGGVGKVGCQLACFGFSSFVLARSFDSGGDGPGNLNVGIDLAALSFQVVNALVLAYLDIKSKLHR